MNKDLERKLGYHGPSSMRPDSADCRKVGIRRADGGGVAADYKRGGHTKKTKAIRSLERDEKFDIKHGRGRNAHHAVEDMIHEMKPMRRSDGGGIDPEYKKGGRIKRAMGGAQKVRLDQNY